LRIERWEQSTPQPSYASLYRPKALSIRNRSYGGTWTYASIHASVVGLTWQHRYLQEQKMEGGWHWFQILAHNHHRWVFFFCLTLPWVLFYIKFHVRVCGQKSVRGPAATSLVGGNALCGDWDWILIFHVFVRRMCAHWVFWPPFPFLHLRRGGISNHEGHE
jgi:hypothetical protein